MKPELIIRYDGKVDLKATYAPVVKKKLFKLGNDFSDFIVDLQHR